jgi:hypothetical protein
MYLHFKFVYMTEYIIWQAHSSGRFTHAISNVILCVICMQIAGECNFVRDFVSAVAFTVRTRNRNFDLHANQT